MRLSPHFTLRELTRSQTAERCGIDNAPDSDQMINLRTIAQNILEPIRMTFDVPFSPSSGFRCQELNDRIGGSTTSQHCKGEAVDIELPGVSNLELAEWCREHLNFDQLILECWNGRPDSGWVHISKCQDNRLEVLTFQRGVGYSVGLPEE